MSEEKELPKVGEWWWYHSHSGEAWKCMVAGVFRGKVILRRGLFERRIVRDVNQLICKVESQKPWWRFW